MNSKNIRNIMKKYILLLLLSVGNQKGSFMNLQAIILAAGKSTRFNTEISKLAHPICGQAMILFPTKLLQTLEIPTTVVVGYQQELIQSIIATEHGDTINFIIQEKQEGTGHALACTKELWNNEHILVINADVPFVAPEIITSLYAEHIKNNAAISFITSSDPDETAKAFGRVIKNGKSIRIVEAKDFVGNINEQPCVNAGIYIINKDFLRNHIANLNTYNANKEFYITDLVSNESEHNLEIATVDVPFNMVRGINTLEELWVAERTKHFELIRYWMKQGVRFESPDRTYLDLNVIIGQGSYIGDGVHLRGNVNIGKNCRIQEYSSLKNVILEDNVTIYAHCVVENSYIRSGAEVGPFAWLRANVTLEQQCSIGSFVEIKNSTIGTETKARHLSYIGDAIVGAHVNIGAGTITCNYDGINKHKTVIKDHAFIGSNNALIAPVTIGSNAYTAAGSTITSDVPDNALAIARTRQINKIDYVHKLKHIPAQHVKLPEPKLDDFSFIGARIIHPDSPEDEQ